MTSTELDWTLAGLATDPFSIEAGVGSGAELRWAGMPTIHQRFRDIILDAVTSSQKQVVLNSGPWGGGKTFAAEFFSSPTNLPRRLGRNTVREMASVVIRTPKAPDKAEQILYRSILERIGFERIRGAANAILTQFSEDQVHSELMRATGSDDLTIALIQLAKTEDAELQFALRTYFLENKASRAELRKLGVARNILSMEDRFSVLAGALQLLIGLAPAEALHRHSRVMLWIDEVEDLVLYPVKYYRPFTQAIRDLLGKMPHYFSLLMNFTLASPEALEDIGVVLGAALLSRVTHRIDFKPLSLSEAQEYVKDLLMQYRTSKRRTSKAEFPFDAEGLQAALSGLSEVERTPRGINRRCRLLVVAALQEGTLPSSVINRSFVAKYDSNIAKDL
jgi:type II secretory pathway predicted ATPase ExeA